MLSELSWSAIFIVLVSVAIIPSCIESASVREKRSLPINDKCNPSLEVCRKGDLIRRDVADCRYDRPWYWPIATCDAKGDTLSWTVDVDIRDKCLPLNRRKDFACGAPGTNSRCVCSDTNILYNPGPNECRCQYWPEQDIGYQSPAFCTGYYNGGVSTLHHWACCNNCDDPSPACNNCNDSSLACNNCSDSSPASESCKTHAWQGGSNEDYCSSCGQNKGGGTIKYFFNCGSCDDQEECESHCNNRFLGSLDLPGLCWRWLDCFKDCCLKLPQPQN